MHVNFHLMKDPTVRVNGLYGDADRNPYLSRVHALMITLADDYTTEQITLFFRDLGAIQRFANNINSEVMNLRAEAINQLMLEGDDAE